MSIASSGKVLLELINDILDLSKIEAEKLQIIWEPIDLQTLIREIEQIFSEIARQKNLLLLIDLDEHLPPSIYFDRVRLRQILFNVVGNALKFTEQGSVKLSVTCSQPIQKTVNLIITVEDTGIGISESDRAQIFNAFVQSDAKTTRQYGGTGLGLAITKRLTEMLGGTVTLKSELGSGSVFTFVFSDVRVLEEGMVANQAVEDVNLNLDRFVPSKILVVDDVPSNLELVESYFADSSHQLFFAQDGLAAIQLATEQDPDLILLDLRMPDLDGVATSLKLKQIASTKDIPIIITTASSYDLTEIQMQNLCQGFLFKPFRIAQLISELEKVLPVNRNQPTQDVPLDPADGIELPLLSLTKTQLTELIEKLREEEATIWPELCKTMKMRDVQGFCDRLNHWVQDYPVPALLEYAQQIDDQLEAFAWDRLPKTIAQFPELRRSLEDVRSEQSPPSVSKHD